MIKSIKNLIVICLSILSLSMFVIVLAAQQQQKREKSTVLGRVTVNGKPAVGIIVALLPGEFTGTMSILDKATTDSDGQYSLTASGSGRYSVAPLAPGYAAESAAAFRQSGKEINLSNGETVRDINFSLKRGGVITGRITRNDGRPLINFPINVRSVDEDGDTDDIFFQNRYMNRTDDRGVYRLYGLQPGKYIISVGVSSNNPGRLISSGNAVIPITYFPSVDDIANATTIEVKEGAETANIDITARKPEKLFTVSGRIVDSANGRPVPNIRYSASRDQGRGGFNGFGFNQTVTNARGEFFLTGLSPGKYNVYGVADDNNNYYSEKVPVEITDHDLTNVDVKLFQGVSLSGLVSVEGAGETDISGEIAKLELFTYSPLAGGRGRGGNARQSGQVNGDGSFTITGISPGQFELALAGFRRSNFSMLRIERNGAVVNNAFEAQGGDKITGLRVVLGYGNGVINGQVKINGIMPEGTRMFVTYHCLTCEGVKRDNFAQVDARGAFTIQGLMTGDYEINLRAFQPGRRRRAPLGQQTVKITAGQSIDVTLVGDFSDEQQPPNKGDDSE